MIHETLYKIDEKDKVRSWFIEQDEHRYRVHSGIMDGKIVVSKFKEAKTKNAGKANEVRPVEQAGLEIQRKYQEQLDKGGYYKTIEAAREGFTTFFSPMLAEKYKDRKDKLVFPVYSSPKLDGARCVSTLNRLTSRKGEDFLTPTKIRDILKPYHEKYPSLIFDGELYNHDMKNDFEKIMSLIKKEKPTAEHIVEANELVEFHIFDLFDFDRPELTFSERIAIRDEIFAGSASEIVMVPAVLCHSHDEIDKHYSDLLEDGYEGQMIRIDGPYEKRRSKTLMKRKEFEDAEFPVIRVEEGKGNWSGAVKSVWISLGDDEQKSGVRGSREFLEQLWQERDTLSDTDVTVRFQGRTKENRLRFPIVTHFWRGKRNV